MVNMFCPMVWKTDEIGDLKGKWRPRMESLFCFPPAAGEPGSSQLSRSCHVVALGFCETVSFLITHSVLPPLSVSAGSLSTATKDSNKQLCESTF